ncbi:cation:dicarboxylate symporter family transporter [Fastidiosibacter lacustris]|uniref:cation:dicarboxylate symporter family transporter n=1 Tax=Fastidiosibacter lacustris TaxID=2056695 RepID=UPI000E34A00C|nr:cation:dicarboxylase symporter family transporter [Fastidiosibacter lacustris]
MSIIVFFTILGILGLAQTYKVSFNIRVLGSLIVGIIFGLVLQQFNDSYSGDNLHSLLDLISDTYISLLKMLIIPLVFTAIINAIVNLRHHQGSYLIKIVTKTVVVILLLTGISAVIGGFIGSLMHIGSGVAFLGVLETSESHSIVSTITGMLPSNPVTAMANNNVIAVVIFAALLGFATLKLHQQEKEIALAFINFIHSAFFVAKKLASMIIALTPYGVFALMSSMMLNYGLSTLLEMLNFITAMYIAMSIVMLLHTILISLCGVNPIHYYKNVWRALLVAFTTRSSFGTLPVTMDALGNRLKLSESVSNFTPSIGATIGMNACAGIYPAMLVVMTLAIMGQPVTWQVILLVGAINMIASFGVSGIPGTAFIAAGVTFSTLGLPFNIIALVQGIDPIIDMGRTATNVNGVMTTAVITDKTTRS